MFRKKEKDADDFKIVIGDKTFLQRPMLMKNRDVFLSLIEKIVPLFSPARKAEGNKPRILEKLMAVVKGLEEEEIEAIFLSQCVTDFSANIDIVYAPSDKYKEWRSWFWENFEMNHFSQILVNAFFLNKNIVPMQKNMGFLKMVQNLGGEAKK
jgi:hypothetical protein